MQICVARMLQESGIFFAVRPLLAYDFPVPSLLCSYCRYSGLASCRVYMLLMLLTAKAKMHLLYVQLCFLSLSQI